MNIKHYEVVELPYISDSGLQLLGAKLFTMNKRTHGDYEDHITLVYGSFYVNDDILHFVHWSPQVGQTTTVIDGDDFFNGRVTGYINLEGDPTGE